MAVSLASAEAGTPFTSEPRTRPPPKYKISRAEDDTLQWEPPIRSRELANALSYHYPLDQSLQEKMQHAILDFLDSEIPPTRASSRDIGTESRHPVAAQDQKFVSIKDQAGTGLLQPTGNVEPQLQSNHGPEVFGVWDIKTGESVKPKGRKRGLSPTTRQRVAENRGNTCAFHRKAKTQCDPTQCRQNKLYPGTGIELRSAKRADQRKRDLKNESLSKGSEILDWAIGPGGSQPFTGIKGLPSQGPPLQKSVKRLECERTPLGSRYSNETSFRPSPEKESVHDSFFQFSGVNNFLPEDSTLLDVTANHTWYLGGNMFGTSPGSQPIFEGAELFHSTSNMDGRRELGPAAMKEFPFEHSIVLPGNWIATEETFGVDRFDWIKDLMPADLLSLEHDWPREEFCATATLSDLSSSPNTHFDFGTFNFEGAEVVLGDSQKERRFHNNLEDVDYEPYSFDDLPDMFLGRGPQAAASFLPSRNSQPSPLSPPSSCAKSKLTLLGSVFDMATEAALTSSEADRADVLTGAEDLVALTPPALEEMPKGARRRRCAGSVFALPAEPSKNTEKSSRLSGGRYDGVESGKPKLRLTEYKAMFRSNSSPKDRPKPALSHSQIQYTHSDKMVSNMAAADCAGETTFSVPGDAIAADKSPVPSQIPVSSHESETINYPFVMCHPARESVTQLDTGLSIAGVAKLEGLDEFGSARAVNHKPRQELESNNSVSSPENALISIEDLTTLLQNSSLRFTGFTEQIYTPKDEQPLADIMLLDDAKSKITLDMNRGALRDVPDTSRSRVRLIRSICSVNLETASKERPSDETLQSTSPSILKSDDVAVDGIYDQESTTSYGSRYAEYIKRLCDQHTTTPHPSGERPVELIYSSAATGTLVNRVLVTPAKVDVSDPPPLSALYSLQWPSPVWRSLESVMSDMEAQRRLSGCAPQGEEALRFERRPAPYEKVPLNLSHESGTASPSKATPHRQRQAHKTSIWMIVDSQKHLVAPGEADHMTHMRSKKKGLVLLGKPVDAVKALWKKLSDLKL